MRSGRSSAHKPDKANKHSNTGTGDLGVLPTHETSPCLGDAGSTRPGRIQPQVQVSTVLLLLPGEQLERLESVPGKGKSASKQAAAFYPLNLTSKNVNLEAVFFPAKAKYFPVVLKKQNQQ